MSTDNPVVIDLGSESVKAGYASHVPSTTEPRLVLPSLVSVQQQPGGSSSSSLHEPVIQRGAFTDLQRLEGLLHGILYGHLGWQEGAEGAALFVEPLFVGKGDREQLTQLMFEAFNVSGLFLHDVASLALAANSKLHGTTIDIGHGKIDIATVSDGVMHAPGAVRMSFAGEQLTQALGQLLAQQQPGLPQLSQQQLGHLKAQCCRAAPSREAFEEMMAAPPPPLQQQQDARSPAGGDKQQPDEQQEQPDKQQEQQDEEQPPPLPPLGTPQTYTLPDGAVITVGTEAVATAEALLRPCMQLGLPPAPGLVDCILECVAELPDASTRRAALDSVLLCGGGACATGLAQRVLCDLRSQLPSGLTPRLVHLPEYMCMPTPQYVAWVGGAVMAKLAAYQSHFMIRAEYEEIGPHAVHRKCA